MTTVPKPEQGREYFNVIRDGEPLCQISARPTHGMSAEEVARMFAQDEYGGRKPDKTYKHDIRIERAG